MNREQIILQTLLVRELKQNKKCEEFEIEPCFGTKELKKLYKKIAGFEYEEDEEE